MIKILFICHGNICRSPIAEFVLKDMTVRQGIADGFQIASAATSREEIGNHIYPPAKAELARHGIGGTWKKDCGLPQVTWQQLAAEVQDKTARQIRREDYTTFDYLIAMERYNIRNMMRVFGDDPDQKICRLLDFTGQPGDIDDPWYTGEFDRAYREIVCGCEGLLRQLGTVQK